MSKFTIKNSIFAIAGLVFLIIALFIIVNLFINSKNSVSNESA
ncbi:hypothetical protein [Aceticella autotrophica]|nr:hypothetical protein [Aceticella autotrophica]